MSGQTIVTVEDGSDPLARPTAAPLGPAESWLGCARRLSGETDPVPVDLSGATKRFRVDHRRWVALRPATRGDLPVLVRWLEQPHVRRWFASDGEPTPQRVEEHYGPDIEGTTPTRLWIAEANGRSVGFVQDYRVGDYPDYALLTPDPDAIGLDYLVGEPAWVGRGVGTLMLWTWLVGVERHRPGARVAFAAPDHRNAASRRLLAKLGFVEGAWFDEPEPDGGTTTVVGHSLTIRAAVG